MMSSIIHWVLCDPGWTNHNLFTESNWLGQMSSQKLHSCCPDCAHQSEVCMGIVHTHTKQRPLCQYSHLYNFFAWSDIIKKKVLKLQHCKPISAVKRWLRQQAGVRNIITFGPTESFQFIKFYYRGVRAVDIEVYHPYSCGENVCSTAPWTEKTGDRNRGPRLKAEFHFNQSACWFSWLRALYKQNQMATSGTGWGRESLGRVMREEMYREGLWEIKILLSCPVFDQFNSHQWLQWKIALITGLHSSSDRGKVSIEDWTHDRTSKRQETRDKYSAIFCLGLTPF